MTRRPPPKPPGEDPALIADLAEAVYRDLLGKKDAASMVEKDGDGGAKLRNRAQAYAPVVRAVVKALRAMEAQHDPR